MKYHETFDDYMIDRFGMDESKFRAMLEEHALLHNNFTDNIDTIISIYKEKWQLECDRHHYENVSLTLLQYLDIYYRTSPDKIHEMLINIEIKFSHMQEQCILDSYRKCWEEHENNLSCPFE